MLTNAVIMTNMCSCVVLISETRSLGVQRLVFLRRQTSLLQRHLARAPIDGVFTLGVFALFAERQLGVKIDVRHLVLLEEEAHVTTPMFGSS